MSSYLKLGIKNNQFTADWNGIVTAVAFHEIHVDCGVNLWEHIGYIISIPPYSHVQACTDKKAEHNTKKRTFFVYFLLLSLVWHLQDSGAKQSARSFQGLKCFAGSSLPIKLVNLCTGWCIYNAIIFHLWKRLHGFPVCPWKTFSCQLRLLVTTLFVPS